MLTIVILKFELAAESPGEFTKHRILGPIFSVSDSRGPRPQESAFLSSQGI